MAVYYLDSSAIVKRYVDEPGSSWIRQLCDAHDTDIGEKLNLITIGDIAVAEVAAAFSVLARRNVISKRITDLAYRKSIAEFRTEYDLVHITPALILAAAELTQQHPLKAYDAVQLALAVHANDALRASGFSLVFVTGDNTLLKAAQAGGLAVENPYEHADLDQAADR
jgi:hypothetical protein